MLLAPVVRERKGEYSNLFEQLQGQGFVRARVDGEIIDIDTPPELDKKKKHTIEVVVDRFKVRDDLGNRIAESFETALRLGGDIAVLSWMNGEHPDRVFSAKHSCPECDRAVAELEPRLFSFNNPFGACPVCDGLGTRSHFSPENSFLTLSLQLVKVLFVVGIVNVLITIQCCKSCRPFRFST